MNKGVVKWYNDTKGFGFIKTEEGNDVFVHRSGLINPFNGLKEGQEVEFEIKEDEKGQKAFNVKQV
ncbi:MAG: cold-shock protein [Marinilabiliales bacterium]|nr:MAG: cold-shock protein [Marinilabiliales bacterium]